MASVEERYRTIQGDMHSMRVGYIVTGATSEEDAIDETLLVAPLSSRAKTQTDWMTSANRNRQLWRWNVGIEEISLQDESRRYGEGDFFTYVTYQHRAICPIPQFDGSTESQRVYEGLNGRRAFTRKGLQGRRLPDSAYVGIETQFTNGVLDVRGTDKLFPGGRINLIWQPLTSVELSSTNAQVGTYLNPDASYVRKCMSRIGTVNSQPFMQMFNTGELLMVSFNGRQIDQRLAVWEFTYGFEFRPNRAKVDVNDISLEYVEGWQHVWGPRAKVPIKSEDGKVESVVSQYDQLLVENLYEKTNFYELFQDENGNNLINKCPYFVEPDANRPKWNPPSQSQG